MSHSPEGPSYMTPAEKVTARFHLGKRRPLTMKRASRTLPSGVSSNCSRLCASWAYQAPS
jgi:hypothetical protein